jgi:hypothetical protein
VAPSSEAEPASARPAAPAGGDLWILALVLAVCLVPLVGLAAGGPWGAGTTGLATAGALLSSGALVHGWSQRRQARG